jgi:hypothetical protein
VKGLEQAWPYGGAVARIYDQTMGATYYVTKAMGTAMLIEYELSPGLPPLLPEWSLVPQ